MVKKKKTIKRNRIIAGALIVASGYVLLVNNSLDFLTKFNISVNQNTVAFIAFFLILIWALWKKEVGEL